MMTPEEEFPIVDELRDTPPSSCRALYEKCVRFVRGFRVYHRIREAWRNRHSNSTVVNKWAQRLRWSAFIMCVLLVVLVVAWSCMYVASRLTALIVGSSSVATDTVDGSLTLAFVPPRQFERATWLRADSGCGDEAHRRGPTANARAAARTLFAALVSLNRTTCLCDRHFRIVAVRNADSPPNSDDRWWQWSSLKSNAPVFVLYDPVVQYVSSGSSDGASEIVPLHLVRYVRAWCPHGFIKHQHGNSCGMLRVRYYDERCTTTVATVKGTLVDCVLGCMLDSMKYEIVTNGTNS